jgi:hypothetical protein
MVKTPPVNGAEFDAIGKAMSLVFEVGIDGNYPEKENLIKENSCF